MIRQPGVLPARLGSGFDAPILSRHARVASGATVALLALLSGGPPAAEAGAQRSAPSVANHPREVTLEDFSDVVTPLDLGFNDFSGAMGTLNSDPRRRFGRATLRAPRGKASALRFSWNFREARDKEAFTGLYWSLFGSTTVKTTFDGETTESLAFPEHVLNLNDIDGELREPGPPRRFEKLRLLLTYRGSQDLTLRLELKDAKGGGRFQRFRLEGSHRPRVLSWEFREREHSHRLGGGDLSLRRAQEATVVVERRHRADRIRNPESGSLELRRISFVSNRRERQPASDDALLDLLERRACQYFVDWASRKPRSAGMPQDRSTFGDLLTVGGVGFALPAYAICSERQWITREEARERTLSVLRALTASGAFGPEPVGRVGYRGWFYHFLGVDGQRKLNFDFPSTPENEALNTVELSTIDTALAVMGALAAQSYFNRDEPDEAEIRSLAQTIYDSVEWPFMLEPSSQQFYLGWKPVEQRADDDFLIPAENGNYSGKPGDPSTLDYYTDEAFIATLLAVGSTTHPVPAGMHCAWFRQRPASEPDLIATYPGSLFTYQFLHAFLDTRELKLPPCRGEGAVDWYANSRRAMLAVMQHAEANLGDFRTYGRDGWGISAAEGPYDEYHAYGAPPVAINPSPEEDGTVAYYAMLSAVSYGDDLRARALAALRRAWRRGHWHPRFGLPDAFNDEIADARLDREAQGFKRRLRTRGPWVQRALFAIDQGPMLLHLENARTGLVWGLLERNPNIQRAVRRLDDEPGAVLEAEDGAGDGQGMARSNASGEATVQLDSGESRTLALHAALEDDYTLTVRYSNDNFGPLEEVSLAVDGVTVGQFSAQDTGDFGAGWNNFAASPPIGPVHLAPGTHELKINVSGGDGFGVEIDSVRRERASVQGTRSTPRGLDDGESPLRRRRRLRLPG